MPGVSLRLVAIVALGGILPAACGGNPPAGPPLKVGLIAPVSGGSATSGRAILRGMLLAADELNGNGGLLGRPVQVAVRDVQNDPGRGVEALRELAEREKIVAVFGGIFSPVMLGQLDAVHRLRIPLINPWGSVSTITRNGRDPNYAFRVSVSDESADEFLVRYAREVVGSERPAIIADTTAWGDSNVSGLTSWLGRLGMAPAAVERFAQGETNVSDRLAILKESGADALILVANAPEGAAVVRGMGTIGWRVPVVSHWGITGGQFVDLAGVDNAEGVLALQTFSFHGPLSPRARSVVTAYHRRFGTHRVDEILAPVGVAHGYDGMHLLAAAVRRAGGTGGDEVRRALEQGGAYRGLVKTYTPAFTPDRHDALAAEDYLMAEWRAGRLVPAARPRLDGGLR